MDIVTGLRCEHLINPLGIEASKPRLSWQMRSDRHDARQSAYQIVVATTYSRLMSGEADLWDSGRVASDASVLVAYLGKRLASRQQCWWQVHTWSDVDEELISEPAYWEMGLLKKSDWKAQWIAANLAKKPDYPHASPLFRRDFKLQKEIASARAYVCGLGFYELYINGRKADNAVLQPAFTKYDTRALYTVLDITACLAQQANTVGIMVGSGWYSHYTKDHWNFYAAPWRDECKALVQIEVTYIDGKKEIIVSNDSWQCSYGPLLQDGLRNGEVYDARLEKEGWSEPGYNASDWRPVRIARPPGGSLHSQLMPPCRVTDTIQPVSATLVKPGTWLFDMGRNIAGWARLTVSGPPGVAVEMRYGERIGSDGDIDQKDINTLVEGEVPQTDTYITKGVEVETYEARFVYHGFQYVQVTGLPANPTGDTLVGRVVHTDLESIGSFECSNELLNRIQQLAIASTLGNYHGMPTDCPHREKNGWTGDAHLSAEQVLLNFDAASAYAKWLDDFTDCQRESGAFPGIVPSGGWGFNWGAGPAWDSAYVLIPWYLYLNRGDLGILERHYEGMRKYLEFLHAMSTDYIVHFGLGDWCPPTPASYQYKTPAALTNTAYYYVDACIVAKIAALLGKKGDERRYTHLAKSIKVAVRQRFYDAENHRLAGHGQTALACFIYQGLVEPDEIALFSDMLLAEVAAHNDHIDCGILGAKYLLHTFTELGHADTAFRIATQTDYPSWGYWVAQGATTLWEAWDGRASRNHHMFSDISAWFYKTLAGINADPTAPGFKHIIIRPWPVGDLTYASGETQTPYGLVCSAWRIEEDKFILDVEIPPNSSATVYLPYDDTGKAAVKRITHAIGSGRHSFQQVRVV